MVGILLALGVNNWNQKMADRKTERAYLRDIYYEFTDNKTQLDRTLTRFRKQYMIANALAQDSFPITDENWPGIKDLYSRAFLPITFDPGHSSIDALINSGKIDLVQNDSLKKLLLDWKYKYNDYKEDEIRLQKWWDVYNDIYLNEPDFSSSRNKIVTPIPRALKIKLEKLLWQRRADLGFSVSIWPGNQESKELMNLINSIITMTSPYLEKGSEIPKTVSITSDLGDFADIKEIFDEAEIQDLKKIIDFFTNAICSFQKFDKDIGRECFEPFFKEMEKRKEREDLFIYIGQIPNIDLERLRREIDTNTFNEIWHYPESENPQNNKSINPNGKYVNFLERLGAEYPYLKFYIGTVTATGHLSSSIVSEVISKHADYDIRDQRIQLFFAVHYLTLIERIH